MQGQNCSGVSTQYGQWREALPTQIRCPQNGIGLGPGDTFGRTMAALSPSNVNIGLVGGAFGGARIEYF